MTALNQGSFVLKDLYTGEVKKDITCREISNMFGVCDATIQRHCISGRPFRDRYEITRSSFLMEKPPIVYYTDEWTNNFCKEWYAMQKLFGIEVKDKKMVKSEKHKYKYKKEDTFV